ncbi:MAG: hypothetical protein GY751_06170 [Bacteroidetes bacterium]|nr:hypothetical protein [Bacteroidota bacterium]
MNKLYKFFGMGGHNCREVIAKVEELIDGELDNASQERLIREINRCPACLEHYNIDVAFKEFVHKRVQRKCCAEKMKSEILSKIKSINLEP